MSSASAGKFQDHYALLGLDPRADSDAIALAYAKASEKYHPNNPETGNPEKFEAVNLAFEVLSDPALRREFDKVKGVSLETGSPKFSGLAFFEAMGRGTGLRLALLCVLYDRRRNRPYTPSLSLRQIDNILYSTEEELNFVLWYLKQRGLAGSDDKSNVLITVEGMDFLENNRPAPEIVMPFVKPTGLATPPATSLPEQPPPQAQQAQSTLQAEAVPSPASAASALSALAAAVDEPVEELAAAPATREPESVMNLMRRARTRT